MELEQEIASWNKKSADDILEIYGRHASSPSFIPDLIPLIAQEATQSGATWLLKQYFEDGNRLAQADINTVYQSLPQLEEWEAKLHILQSIPYMPIPASEAARVHSFLHQCVTDTKKFVRAWAYNGFDELATQHQEFAAETEQLLESALQDEATSVKARVRNILKDARF